MVCNEVRKDYLLNRWVVIATERSRRPTDFIKAKHHHVKEILCPLCVGNEDLTPPAVLLYLNENGKILKTEDNFKQRKRVGVFKLFLIFILLSTSMRIPIATKKVIFLAI